MGKKYYEFEVKDNCKKRAARISEDEVEKLKKIKKVDDQLAELKNIAENIVKKIDKWNRQK